MREREDLIAAPDALNLTVFTFEGGQGSGSPPTAIGKCKYFSVGADSASNLQPVWWILFGNGPSMPDINPASTKPTVACFGPYTGVKDFWPECNQDYFRVFVNVTGTVRVRFYRSSLP